MSEIVLYADSVEYLYASVLAFEVDGVPADPTSYGAEVAIVAIDADVLETDWVVANWVAVGTTDRVRILAGDPSALTAGRFNVFVRLTGPVETIVRQAGKLTVRDM